MLANIKVISFVLAIILGSIYSFVTQSTKGAAAVYKTDRVFGYDVTGIVFDLNETDPTVVDTISFHVAPSSGSTPARQVKIQTKLDGAWTECSVVDAVHPAQVATCTFQSLTVDDVIALNIDAR
jgi:hypothetical protein